MERQKKLAEQNREMEEAEDPMEVEVITSKEDINKSVVEAWNTSDKLIPYAPLIEFMTHCFRVAGYDAIVAKCKANDLAEKLASSHVVYDKLKTSNEDDLESMLKNVKLPKDIETGQLCNMILDHFRPSDEIIAEGLPDDDIADEQDLDDEYTLQELFKVCRYVEVKREAYKSKHRIFIF